MAGGSDANTPLIGANSLASAARAIVSSSASLVMYCVRLPGSGWLLIHCGPEPPLLFGLTLDRLEHARERARIVAGARHDLRAEEICLLLEVAAVSQEQRPQPELAALRDCRSYPPAHDRAANGAGKLTELQPRVLCLGGIGGAMAKQHVRQLVRHHSDDLALGRCRVEHAAVHEHRPARKRKGIDLFQVHRRERVLVDWIA